MNKRINRIAGIVLSLAMVFSTMTAYATDKNVTVVDGVEIQVISDNKIQINDSGEISFIEIESINTNTTEVRVLNSDEETLVLTVDKDNHTVRSSITGETISVDNDFLEVDSSSSNYVSKTRYKYITYAKIKSLLGGTSTIAAIAGVVISLLVAAGFEVPGMLPVAVSLLENITSLISNIMNGSSNHGLKITLKSYMKTLHHGHETSQVEAWRITAISKY